MITVYFAEILCHSGTVVMNTIVYPSAKQAAAVATDMISNIPPAAGFNIRKQVLDAKAVARLMNNKD